MKGIEKLMRKFEPSHDGKWHKLHPVWDGFYTILFTPGDTTKKGSHIRDAIDLKRTMALVVMALVPCLLFGIYNTGHWHFVATGEIAPKGEYLEMFGDKVIYGLIQVLPIVVVSYAVGLAVEFAFCIKNQHAIQEGYLVSGMLIPLIVPADTPLWMVAVAVIFAVVLGKEVFGGTGMNIVNIALTARAFLFFGYPTMMSGDKVWMSGISGVETLPEGVTGATALGEAASFTFAKSEWVYEGGIKAFEANWTLWDSFVGMIPGSVGETSVIACLLGAVLLLATGIASWRIMLSFVAGGLLVGWLANQGAVNPYHEMDPLLHLCLGGFAFGAVFMITDPVTASQTNTGKFIYGFLGGALAITIRVFNGAYPEGVMMAILFMNIMAPTIDHYVVNANIKRRMKRIKTA